MTVLYCVGSMTPFCSFLTTESSSMSTMKLPPFPSGRDKHSLTVASVVRDRERERENTVFCVLLEHHQLLWFYSYYVIMIELIASGSYLQFTPSWCNSCWSFDLPHEGKHMFMTSIHLFQFSGRGIVTSVIPSLFLPANVWTLLGD